MHRRVAARSQLLLARGVRCLQSPKVLHTASPAAASGAEEIRYLVVDGYVKLGRDVLKAGGATTAGQLYANMLVKATKRSVGRSAEYDLVYPADPGFVVPDLSKYHGVGWSGSSLAVREREDPSVVQMMNLARLSFARGIPQFGSCFGLQLAVATAGGVVQKNQHGKELGVARKIHLNAAGRAHPMYEGKPSVFDAFSSHKDEVRVIQPGGLLLATNAFTTVQSVCLRYLKGEFWGLQYHPEYDLHEMARLLYCRRDMNTQLGFFTDVEDSDRFVDLLEELAADPSREDIAWQIGYDKDVLDEDLRTCEVKNFVKHSVMPYYVQCQQGGDRKSRMFHADKKRWRSRDRLQEVLQPWQDQGESWTEILGGMDRDLSAYNIVIKSVYMYMWMLF